MNDNPSPSTLDEMAAWLRREIAHRDKAGSSEAVVARAVLARLEASRWRDIAAAPENTARTLIGYAVVEAKEHVAGPETMLLHWRVERALRTRIAAALTVARAQMRERALQAVSARWNELRRQHDAEFSPTAKAALDTRCRELTFVEAAIRALPDEENPDAE